MIAIINMMTVRRGKNMTMVRAMTLVLEELRGKEIRLHRGGEL